MTDVDKKESSKKTRPSTASTYDTLKTRPSTASTYDSIFPEKSKKKSHCSRWCTCCQKKKAVFDEELAQIVGERKRKKSTEGQRRIDNYLSKKDGCVETGYFVRPDVQVQGGKTLEGLRKSSKVTRNLPNPRVAIQMHNSKHDKKLKFRQKAPSDEESHVSEINKMLRNRLTGTIVLDSDDPNEESEALLSCSAMALDMQPVILSQLVQGSDTRRMSFSSENDRTRRRSSFVLRNVDLSVEQSIYESVYSKLQNKLKDTNDSDFINTLPKISKMIKNELESNLPHTQRYIKNLKTLFKNAKFGDQGKIKRTTERWMVILYTTSEEKVNTLTDFNCNLVRLILQHHCVAYEERDIALKKQPFRNQLRKSMGSDDVRVPYVCAKGISVGITLGEPQLSARTQEHMQESLQCRYGVQVIFAMHKMKVVDYIFKDFIMPPSVYVDWLYRRTKQKSGLTLNVKLSGFPALSQMLTTNYEAYLIRSDRQVVKRAKVTIKKARELWNLASQEAYTQPNLLKFVLLKNTIILAYAILNSVYLQYLPGHQKAELVNRCCRWCR